MKTAKLLIVTAATLVAQLVWVRAGAAQGMFDAYVTAVAISTNQAGEFTYHRLDNRDLIRECAAETGLTNLMGLHLVYDLTSDAVEVVGGTNQTVLCAPLTFSGGEFLSNTNDNTSRRLSFVYWETNQVPSGTVLATEHYAYGVSNQLTGFDLIGQLQFALPGNGTNAPTIYRGRIVAGSNLFEEDDFGGNYFPNNQFQDNQSEGDQAAPDVSGSFDHRDRQRD